MNLLATVPAQAASSAAAPAKSAASAAGGAFRGRWPLAAFAAAGALGTFPMIGAKYFDEDVTGKGPLAVYDAIKDTGVATHISMVLAFVGAIALAVFASGFLRFLNARVPEGSGLGTLARLGVSSAVGLSFAIALLKAVFRGGLPDHMDHTMYTKEAVGTFQVILDQLQYTGLWPLTLVMGVVAVLAFHHKVLPKWYGLFSGVLLVATLAMALVLGLPYFAGLVGPLWIVASGIVVLRHRNRSVAI